MKGCWDPEFEPSVEEIVDYPMISFWRFSQFAFSSELAFRAGGFPYSVERMAGEGQPAQAARPNIVRVYGACAVCRCVLVRIYGGVFVRDSGRSLQVVHYVTSRVPINKSIRPRDEVIMMNNDETYDEIMM